MQTTAIFLLFILLHSCDSGNECWYRYYQLKNNSGYNIMIKFYFTDTFTGKVGTDTVWIENRESSKIYEEFECPPAGEQYYVASSDSLDILANDVLLKRYRRRTDSENVKSPYNISIYDDVTDELGKVVKTYTILDTDF